MDLSFLTNAVGELWRDANPLALVSRIAVTVVSVLIILLIFKLFQVAVMKTLKGKLSDQRTFLIQKSVKYAGMVLALLFVFRNLGIDTAAILGAAGVAGIVFGFAAQTSMSSFISGFFILSEQPFHVGDAIKVGDITGVVLSVDLLSVKIRTYDNLFVRIPNENIIKNNLTTVTRFPIRRLDLKFTVGYREDLEKVRDLLMDVAAKNIYCLDNPPPFFGIDGFDASGITLLFCLWFEKANFWALKNSVIISIKKRFEEADIEIPYQKIDININTMSPHDGEGAETGQKTRSVNA
ncbi:MAG: mechanosensitive ion channel family protein [Spirochaetaceae bacterium]|jgi:small-conductance mechanosensitive channel|nr:mechanosensitive ion channel family protein [Spirochaetaceae bacterium]